MDLGTAIVGFIALALFSLPFVLDHRRRSKRHEQTFRSLQGMARDLNCSVDHHGSCGQMALGLDQQKNMLFFVAQGNEGITSHHIRLSDVRSCRTVKATRSDKGQDGDGIVERLELCLLPKDKGRNETRFELYRSGMGAHLNGELEFADKWSGLINDRLKESVQ